MNSVTFSSFGRVQTGRLVTQTRDCLVIYARNPYGKHNLVLVDKERGEAFAHGNIAVLQSIGLQRAYRKARAFLGSKGVGTDWVFA